MNVEVEEKYQAILRKAVREAVEVVWRERLAEEENTTEQVAMWLDESASDHAFKVDGLVLALSILADSSFAGEWERVYVLAERELNNKNNQKG